MGELSTHSMVITKKLKLKKMYHWVAKTCIVQLKVKRPILRESARNPADNGDLLRFCNHIIAAHCTGAFGGKPTLWDFLKDVVANLNWSKSRARFTNNSKSFCQAMKMYGGRHMIDLFNINYNGLSYSTVKQENKKGVQFIQGVLSNIFQSVAKIYKAGKLAHRIKGPIFVLVAEDETKVKARVTWDPKFDTLVDFYGVKDDHDVCISNFRPLIGSGESGYNAIVDAFRTN